MIIWNKRKKNLSIIDNLFIDKLRYTLFYFSKKKYSHLPSDLKRKSFPKTRFHQTDWVELGEQWNFSSSWDRDIFLRYPLDTLKKQRYYLEFETANQPTSQPRGWNVTAVVT